MIPNNSKNAPNVLSKKPHKTVRISVLCGVWVEMQGNPPPAKPTISTHKTPLFCSKNDHFGALLAQINY